jgi:hypothetical protein
LKLANRFHITGNKEEGVVLRLFREANKASAKLEVVASRPLWRPWRLVPIDSDSEVEASDVVSMMVLFCGMPAAGVIVDAIIV